MKENYANPAVVGLSAFSISMMMMQFYLFGLCSLGSVMVTAVLLGGAVQIYAGMQMFHVGDSYEYVMFVIYGAFWMILGGIWGLKVFGISKFTANDMACFYTCWTVFAAVMTFVAARMNAASAFLQVFICMGMFCMTMVNIGLDGFSMASSLFFALGVMTSIYMLIAYIVSDGDPEFGPAWLSM